MTLGCALWLHRLIRHHGRVTRGEPRLVATRRPHGQRRAGAPELARRDLGRARAVPARRDRRRQPGGASAHRRHVPVRELRHDVARRQHGDARAVPRTSTSRSATRMREAAPATLLDFAIAASIAVVPVLLRRADRRRRSCGRRIRRATRARNADQHVSVRQVAALKTFERAIVRRDAVHGARCRRAKRCSTAFPQCRARVGRPRRRDAPAAALLARGRERDALAGAADGGAARGARRGAAALQHRRQSPRRATPWASTPRAGSTRCARRCETPIEAPEYPGPQVHRAVRRHRERGRDARARRRPDAARARVARHRGRARRSRAGGPSSTSRSRRGTSRARNPVARLAGLRLHGRAGDRRRRRRPDTSSRRPRRRRAPVRPAGDARRRRADAGTAAPARHRRRGDAATWPSTTRAGGCRRRSPSMLQPLATLQRPTGSLYRLYTDAQPRPAHADRLSLRAESHRRRRHADRRRLLDRPHHRSRGAGARAADRRVLHRAPGRLPRAGHCAQAKTRRTPIGHRMLEQAIVRMAAHRGHRRRERPHRGARRRAVAVHARGVRRSGPLADCDKRLPYPIRYRPDALLNPAVFHDAMPASIDQADHGRGVPLRSRRRRALARRRARGDAAHADGRRATACAAS